MASIEQPKLQPRSMIPAFQLMSTDGRPVNVWDYKNKKNLVLAFLPGPDCPICVEFLHSATNAYHRYEEDNSELIAVVCGGVYAATALKDEIEPPFPVVFDETGGVTQRYTNQVPAVFVADKFGELYAEWIPGPGGALPTQKEILDVLDLINLECPE